MIAHARALLSDGRLRATNWLLAHRIRALHPTLYCHPTAIWDYAYRDAGDIEIGEGVSVGAFAEIIVHRRSKHSQIEGRLRLGDRSIISAGTNVRAAGGEITIGVGAGIGQNCAIVAANHQMAPGVLRLSTPWDEVRCGVTVGDNVWVGANSVLLPGCMIGDNSVIAAGSVVNGQIPADELWGGTPARKLRDIR